jgi:hypothetical protein
VRNKKPIYHSLPILLIGLLILRNAVQADKCYGIADGLIQVLLWLLGLVILGITLVTSTKRYHRQGDTLELLPLFVPGGLLILYVVIASLQTLWAGEPVLYAKMEYGSDLTLKENKTYRLQDAHDDWGCFYSGDYTIRGDTLRLEGEVEKATYGTFADSYLVRETHLAPLVRGKVGPDSVKYLSIKKQKVERLQAAPR